MTTRETPVVREAQSPEHYNPSAKQKAAAKLSRIPVKVEQAEVLGRPETVDRTAELIERHRTVKLFVGAFLNAFEFRGAGAVQVAGTSPPTYTIDVGWQETGLGAVGYQLVIRVPNI